MDRVLLVGHNFETIREISIDALNQHEVIVVSQKGMAIDVQ